MSEPKRTQATIQRERALLVGVILPRTEVDPHDPLGEIRSLVKTAGAQVVDEMIARRAAVHPGLYVGSGKAQEIADRAQQNKANVIVFDNDLSPGQIRELEKVTLRRVLDRSEVILDIFAAHARSAESMAQVELAQLEYTYPRLQHMWSHLERVAGGASTAASAVGGIGTRGPGEKQLEIDRRLLQRRVTQLKAKIREIDGRKQRQVGSRREEFRICLVGYTNAGKSTMMNLLTGAGVYVADKLFATLDTRTRRWNLGEGTKALLSDTVGFISNLPHHLVASFRATLEEAIGADLLLHVADASHSLVDRQIKAVNDVLDQLGIGDKPRLLLLNKSDRINDPTVRTVLGGRYPGSIFISAATGENADQVIANVTARIRGGEVSAVIEADAANGRLLQYLTRFAHITSQNFTDGKVRLEVTMGANNLEALKTFGRDVRVVKTP